MSTQLLIGDLSLIELPPRIHSLTSSPVDSLGKGWTKLLKDPGKGLSSLPGPLYTHAAFGLGWQAQPRANRATIMPAPRLTGEVLAQIDTVSKSRLA